MSPSCPTGKLLWINLRLYKKFIHVHCTCMNRQIYVVPQVTPRYWLGVCRYLYGLNQAARKQTGKTTLCRVTQSSNLVRKSRLSFKIKGIDLGVIWKGIKATGLKYFVRAKRKAHLKYDSPASNSTGSQDQPLICNVLRAWQFWLIL